MSLTLNTGLVSTPVDRLDHQLVLLIRLGVRDTTSRHATCTNKYGDFYADLHWKEFSSMYHIFKEEKNVDVVFRCDGQGGYREIHVNGGSKTEQLKQMTETLMAKKPCAAIASPVG